MKRLHRRKLRLLGTILLLLPALHAFSQTARSTQAPPAIDETIPPASDAYALGSDSLPQKGAPAGTTFSFELDHSRIFPGTMRTITVYIPAAYRADRPACVYVGLDGLGFNVPTVFDNLIAQHAMPVTIAVGLTPGSVDSAHAPENPRFDRSYEFDSMNDRLARFLLEEVLPAVEQHTTPTGLPIRLSINPNDRAIGGGSTGGIGAFTVAWQHPEAFRRVFTAIGTFVGMRGGEQYYVLVRKTEPEPLRIFMQDGVHDEWGGGPEMGDWWMSNLTMNRALEFAGYDVRHVWGTGTHNGNQASAVFPDAMRWLWRDWPSPIAARPSENPVLQAILPLPYRWDIAATHCAAIAALSADSRGHVYYSAGSSARLFAVDAADRPIRCPSAGNSTPFAFGPHDKIYQASPRGGIQISTGISAKPVQTLASGLSIAAFTVRSNGDVYALTTSSDLQNNLCLITPGKKPILLDKGLKDASGIALSPDGLWLFVAQRGSRHGLSYRVLVDGDVDARAPFYDFYVPAWADASGAAQLAMDEDGRAYAATSMGVQIFDRNGRVAAILPLPGNVPATSLCFGGEHFDTLYVAGGSTIYKRKLRVTGAPPWATPTKLPPWGAG